MYEEEDSILDKFRQSETMDAPRGHAIDKVRLALGRVFGTIKDGGQLPSGVVEQIQDLLGAGLMGSSCDCDGESHGLKRGWYADGEGAGSKGAAKATIAGSGDILAAILTTAHDWGTEANRTFLRRDKHDELADLYMRALKIDHSLLVSTATVSGSEERAREIQKMIWAQVYVAVYKTSGDDSVIVKPTRLSDLPMTPDGSALLSLDWSQSKKAHWKSDSARVILMHAGQNGVPGSLSTRDHASVEALTATSQFVVSGSFFTAAQMAKLKAAEDVIAKMGM
jgi:hypothetical protein